MGYFFPPELARARTIGLYADFRTRGWSREKTLDVIAEDLHQIATNTLGIGGGPKAEDRHYISSIANPEKISEMVDAAERHPCPTHVAEHLLQIVGTLYGYDEAWSEFRHGYFLSEKPLFSEEFYEQVEQAAKHQRRHLREQ